MKEEVKSWGTRKKGPIPFTIFSFPYLCQIYYWCFINLEIFGKDKDNEREKKRERDTCPRSLSYAVGSYVRSFITYNLNIWDTCRLERKELSISQA